MRKITEVETEMSGVEGEIRKYANEYPDDMKRIGLEVMGDDEELREAFLKMLRGEPH